MGHYKLSSLAANDLDQILDYTWEEFGEAQATKYIADLKEHLNLLSHNPRLASEHIKFKPPVRIFPSGSHFIIYTIEDNYIYVVRFIHQKMDLDKYL